MEEKEYIKRIDTLFAEMLSTSNKFATLVKEYYNQHPKEKGKRKNDFYARMSRMSDEFERCSIRLQQALKDPDSVQGYDTR